MPAIIPARIAVADANVLINLIHVQRLGMLASLPGYDFVAPDDVVLEVIEPAQRSALDAALSAGHLRREPITDPKELARYAELRQVMGAGEAARISGWPEEKTDPSPCTQIRATRRRRAGSATMPSSQTPSPVRVRTSETGTLAGRLTGPPLPPAVPGSASEPLGLEDGGGGRA